MRGKPAEAGDLFKALESVYKLTKTKSRVGSMDVWETQSGKAILVPPTPPAGKNAFPYEVLDEIIEQLVALGDLRPDPGPPKD